MAGSARRGGTAGTVRTKMIPFRLCDIQRHVVADPLLRAVMPVVWRELEKSPWRVELFEPGGVGQPDGRPLVLVDDEGCSALRNAQRIRAGDHERLIYIVAGRKPLSSKRLSLWARLGVDDVLMTQRDEDRLLDQLQRVAVAQALAPSRRVASPPPPSGAPSPGARVGTACV